MAVYLLHLWPPLGPKDAPRKNRAEHYTGTAKDTRVRARLTDHALGRGAKMLKVHVARGGKWVVAKVEPGGYERERQLKQRGATRRCDVCKAKQGLEAGQLSTSEALARAGWESANPAERTTLLQIFGLEADAAPEDIPHVEPREFVPRETPEPVTEISPELDATVDELIAGWTSAALQGELSIAPERGAEMEVEAG